MKPYYTQEFELNDITVDRFDRMKISTVLWLAQEVAGRHSAALSAGYDAMAARGLFWAVTRHRVQITRLPKRGETIRLETWPMPTTRVAFPRSVVAYDQQGQECFRAISIWVLMDKENRSIVLPGNSGVIVNGLVRGNELDAPNSLASKDLQCSHTRTVSFSDLDRNGHMNNTKYMDWIDDLMPSGFHENHSPREMIICYLMETWEGQQLDMHWGLLTEDTMQVDAYRQGAEKRERVFSARFFY